MLSDVAHSRLGDEEDSRGERHQIKREQKRERNNHGQEKKEEEEEEEGEGGKERKGEGGMGWGESTDNEKHNSLENKLLCTIWQK